MTSLNSGLVLGPDLGDKAVEAGEEVSLVSWSEARHGDNGQEPQSTERPLTARHYEKLPGFFLLALKPVWSLKNIELHLAEM